MGGGDSVGWAWACHQLPIWSQSNAGLLEITRKCYLLLSKLQLCGLCGHSVCLEPVISFWLRFNANSTTSSSSSPWMFKGHFMYASFYFFYTIYQMNCHNLHVDGISPLNSQYFGWSVPVTIWPWDTATDSRGSLCLWSFTAKAETFWNFQEREALSLSHYRPHPNRSKVPKSSVVAFIYSLSIQKAEAGGLLWVWVQLQSGLQSETCHIPTRKTGCPDWH